MLQPVLAKNLEKLSLHWLTLGITLVSFLQTNTATQKISEYCRGAK